MDAREWLMLIGAIVGPGGAAWLGIKAALNGVVRQVDRIEEKLDETQRDVGDIRERLAVLERTPPRRNKP